MEEDRGSAVIASPSEAIMVLLNDLEVLQKPLKKMNLLHKYQH